jgi:hypothetical protein
VKLQVTLTVKAPGEREITICTAIVFSKGHAVMPPWNASAADLFLCREGTVFDLVNHSWFDADNRQWVDLEACQAWESGSWLLTEMNLENAPDELQPLFRSLVEPDFQVTELIDQRLLLHNPRLRFEVTPGPEVSSEALSQFYAYDRINAYHKSMTEEKLPPTPQLAFIAELEKRSIFPQEIVADVWTPRGEVSLVSRMEVCELSASELEWAGTAIGTAYAG